MPIIKPGDKIKANSEYGKGWHGTEVTAAGIVHHIDAISPYPDITIYYDGLTDVELLMNLAGDTITIRVGEGRLSLNRNEWRGLYSGILNIGPGDPNITWTDSENQA